MPSELCTTYRVQLHAGFGFADAAAIADYLAGLGVSHLYSSPVLQAAPSSTHGYDVVDPRRVNEELGGETGHTRLQETLAGRGLGQVLDIVPNHMAIGGRENAWWWDVLENGPASRYARYFDVDWNPPEARLRDTVLMPILGERYGQALEAGQIQLARADGTFTVHYFDHVLPVAPRSLDYLLRDAAERIESDELAFLADVFGSLPPASATDTESVARRHRDKEVLRGLLADLCRRNERVAQAIDAVVGEINADARRLDDLLERQNYRLTFWRAAERELDYRRFFDINTLVGLHVEDERVFDDTHALVLRWLAKGVLDGVRIDYMDGLRDPETYLRRLRASAPSAWIVVEKILEPGESLPASWPVAGTTGYDFLNLSGGLFVDPAGEQPLTELYTSFTQQTADYRDLVHDTKLQVLRETLGSDVNRLTALWLEVCQQHRRSRDYTRHELQEGLREVVACFPVYRTYVQAESGLALRGEDARVIGEAIKAARAGPTWRATCSPFSVICWRCACAACWSRSW
jgi:(1->4)-alpha-D-glucan 1-alpha-D-glucosylmutase